MPSARREGGSGDGDARRDEKRPTCGPVRVWSSPTERGAAEAYADGTRSTHERFDSPGPNAVTAASRPLSDIERVEEVVARLWDALATARQALPRIYEL